jgi:ABC-type bacteriocin/lantibiotic exporter with double-glycine peptidase domain
VVLRHVVAHAFVVVEASASGILVYDPLHGERTLSGETFRAAWALMATSRFSSRDDEDLPSHLYDKNSPKPRQS